MTQSSVSTKKMELEDWLKCNKCYRAVKNSLVEFYVTQCEHIFCFRCVQEARNLCPECKAVKSQAIPVKQIPQQIMHYFGSISMLNERTLEATRFQGTQFNIFKRRVIEIETKYQQVSKIYAEESEALKKRMIMDHQLQKYLKKLQSIESLNVHQNLGRSNNHREERVNQYSANSQAQLREFRKVPDISNPLYSQRSKFAYAPQSFQSRNSRDPHNSSRPSNDHRENQIIQKNYDQTKIRSGWSSRLLPQNSIIAESQKIPAISNFAQSRSSAHYQRESQRRDFENAQRNVRQIHGNQPYNPNSAVEESSYLSKTIFDTGYSSLKRTPGEKILRSAMNQRIPRSLETSSSASSSGGTVRYIGNAGARPNYNDWNMRS